MKALRLTLSLAVCVPDFALLGAMAAADSYFPSWGGALIGAALGLFFGLAFGGALPRRMADYVFGAEEPAAPDGREP
jgi:hydrogenase/urease accessory protein HupE